MIKKLYVDKILTYWFKIKLMRWNSYKKTQPNIIHSEDDIDIIQLYEEYEKRKKLKKIEFSLLIRDDYFETKAEVIR